MASAPKYLYFDAAASKTKLKSAAVASAANSIVATGAAGTLDPSFMPPGMVTTVDVTVSETIANGAFVNIYYDGGAGGVRVRNADSHTPAKFCNGFVLVGAGSGTVTVYTDGFNNQAAINDFVASQDEGLPAYLDGGANAGKMTKTAPSTVGYIVQHLGYVYAIGSPSSMDFEPEAPVELT